MSIDERRIGILGGGQLGRMLMQAGQLLNLNVVVLENDSNSPAKQVTNNNSEHITGSFNDPVSIKALADKVDLLTVEIEHVNVEVLEEIEKTTNVRVSPSPATIRTIQDKYIQKEHLMKHAIPVAKSIPLLEQSPEALKQTVDNELAGVYPVMLKARRQAYDGKGNYLVKSPEDAVQAVETLSKTAGSGGLYVEKLAPFVAEIAVMVVRSESGKVVAYPAVETVHEDSVCSVVFAPLQTKDSGIQQRAQDVARNAISTFTGAGVFGVEMFLLGDECKGQILLNEIAPRPHNSGHYTIEACATSQYANHLRAILDLPLGATDLVVPYAGMINLLGRNDGSEEGVLKLARKALEIPGAHVHLYGKAGCRKGRKMGHITVVGESSAAVHARIDELSALLPPSDSRVKENPLAHISALLPSPFKKANNKSSSTNPLVSVIMGSDSDLKVMNAAAEILKKFEIPYELTIVSAHRTPDRMVEFAKSAPSRGVRCIIAGAGGAAHLPGMVAAMTPLPVIGVPVKGSSLDGVDSLHSIVQMPRGIPVATVAINGGLNAGLLAVRVISAGMPRLLNSLDEYKRGLEEEVYAKIDKIEDVAWENYKGL
ncbi:phosphoribosylaminoimidazole carboxylase [Wallemia mellicola]|nr:phosphoribosylaminoimidazole carboxylase [Wallemia mellicola]TIC10059.1 phosphoribosylaminoimidazole carboxylase [Wallemia mellicola]TIC41521.1 phosphoribosylaminoimidazole carboxylase [Wallemia mellicola]TIC53101.1 phosphoribosylaminoimidazole carboxylase [Wallemia mellicola]